MEISTQWHKGKCATIRLHRIAADVSVTYEDHFTLEDLGNGFAKLHGWTGNTTREEFLKVLKYIHEALGFQIVTYDRVNKLTKQVRIKTWILSRLK